ncbi:DUF1214 domain-containing protein [Nocardioides yefusunii]|uniref:DUF1214 domain-containing protein n=1 Tax=Nocardioides yefusunii TaxID=2500546 RepID=A0ABW1QZ71_9ACTN|nr:DUF1214 domain-containing protein [Nocardioides yefusunii]
MAVKVNVDNFVVAETARMFEDLQREAGGVNAFNHVRTPSPVDNQLVVRLNRDTLYSFGVVDLRGGATLTVPEVGQRYVSVMVVDENHFVTEVLHEAGTHTLDEERHGSRWVCLAVRVLADPADAADLDEVHRIQDACVITAASAEPFVGPEYDATSFDATRSHLLELANGLSGFDHMFGRREEVQPVRHLLGSAAGWGGLPSSEAQYVGVLGPGEGGYELRLADVPVDGFWSISMYDSAGFFVPNDRNAYSVNDITAVKDADGGVTVRFGDFPDDVPNVLPTPEGWNYLVRLYRPRPEIADGTWQLPAPVPVD